MCVSIFFPTWNVFSLLVSSISSIFGISLVSPHHWMVFMNLYTHILDILVINSYFKAFFFLKEWGDKKLYVADSFSTINMFNEKRDYLIIDGQVEPHVIFNCDPGLTHLLALHSYFLTFHKGQSTSKLAA